MRRVFPRFWALARKHPIVSCAAFVVPILLSVLDTYSSWEARLNELGAIWPYVWKLGIYGIYSLVAVFLFYVFWPEIKKRLASNPFELRPMHGDALNMPLAAALPGVGVARLGVKNVSGRPLEKCSVRLLDAFYMRNGILWNAPGMHPSVHELRGETFLLRWADKESATPDHKYLDIPSDGVERIAEVLVIDETNPVFALFAAADPNDSMALRGVGDNWCKIRLHVGSTECHQEIELVAACGDHGGPITLDYWNPRGEAIMSRQRAEHESEKREREERRKQESQQSAE